MPDRNMRTNGHFRWLSFAHHKKFFPDKILNIGHISMVLLCFIYGDILICHFRYEKYKKIIDYIYQ